MTTRAPHYLNPALLAIECETTFKKSYVFRLPVCCLHLTKLCDPAHIQNLSEAQVTHP